MNIRNAKPDDIPTLVNLEKHAVTAAHWSHSQYSAIFSESAPRRMVLVLEEGITLQGFLIAREAGKEWEIENVAVAESARRRGFGARLLGEFLDRARSDGATAVFLEVRESNLAARALYEKWAFHESGRRLHYYADPSEDAVTYRLDFA